MISKAVNSITVLTVFLISVLLTPLFYYLDNAIPVNAAIPPVAPTITKNSGKSVTNNHEDKFGIQEIYPTKPGGREWFINMSSPLHDKNFSLSGGGERASNSSVANASSINGQIIKQRDGSYEVYGVRKTGKYDFSVRMTVNSSDSDTSQWWKNVEMTGYAKVVSLTSSNPALDWYARGRLHISSSPCQGVAYHGGLRADGSVFWQKEIWHTGGYTDFRGDQNVTHPILGKWIGFKVIMFNTNNDSAVRLQLYLDDNATNHWRKVNDILDNGGWYAIAPDDYFYSANCGRSKDYIILNGGPIATFRSDNMIWDFRDLSIREIQPPQEVNTSSVKQVMTNSSSTFNPYVFGNATQEWGDSEHNIKVLFTPSPEYPSVGNLTTLNFKVQNLQTGSYLKNEIATVTVLNNITANINNVTNKGTATSEFALFKNIEAPNGMFSVRYKFSQPGTHQVIARINSKTNPLPVLASFSILVPSVQ